MKHRFRPANPANLDRRTFLRLAASTAGVGFWPLLGRTADATPTLTPPLADLPQPQFARFPEKTDLILHTDRPPNLETPLKYFREDLTPNEAFFVRWHLGIVPVSVDAKSFRLEIKGHVGQALALTLDELRNDFDPVSLIAVNQCSGNSRALFEPRVLGGQWGNGAIGNAKWTGVRLSDILKRANPKAGAAEVSFTGLDRAPLPSVPLFTKSLSVNHANDGEVMVAYEMNGQPLPMLNGYPLRLIVPGWFATYWVKSLNEIAVLDKPFDGFWMAKAYRIPNNPAAQELPTDLAKETVPINRMPVRSLFVSPEPAERLPVGQPHEVNGLAFDAGKGIQKVEVSPDAGKSWSPATLDPDLGRYSWRRWRFRWTPATSGPATLMARATNASGEAQTSQQWNRSGYARNVIESVSVTIAS